MIFACVVPTAHCKGAKVQVEPGNRRQGIHGSSKEMHKCIQNYLVNVLGYKQKSKREYITDEGRVLVISKKPGMPLRRGKEGTRYIHRKMHVGASW